MSGEQGRARVGISGWRYAPWRGVFYPKGLVQKKELEYVSEQLETVEINGTFYALQKPSSYAQWSADVPDDFVFSLKGSRYITHIQALRDIDQALPNFFASGMLSLGPKLGPILWQLPPWHRFDPEELAAFLGALPHSTAEAAEIARRHDERMEGKVWLDIDEDRPLRHALEIRNKSFDTDEFSELMKENDVAIVVADSAGRFPQIFTVTSDFMYVRLHGAEELYVSGYPDDLLREWADRIDGWRTGSTTPDGAARDVYVYCDNDAKVRAPYDAKRLREMLDEIGASVKRD